MKSKCCNADVVLMSNLSAYYRCDKCWNVCQVAEDVVHAPHPLAYRDGDKCWLETTYCGKVEITLEEYEEIKKLFSLKIN